MAATLFCLPCAYEDLHCFEDLVCAPHMSVDEMFEVDLQKPMVFFVLLKRPVTSVDIFVLVTCSSPLSSCLSRCVLSLDMTFDLFSSIFLLDLLSKRQLMRCESPVLVEIGRKLFMFFAG